MHAGKSKQQLDNPSYAYVEVRFKSSDIMPLTPEERREKRLRRIREEYVDPYRATAQSALAYAGGAASDTESTTGSRIGDEPVPDNDWPELLCLEDELPQHDVELSSDDETAALVHAVEMDVVRRQTDPDVLVPAPAFGVGEDDPEEEGDEGGRVSCTDIENFLVGLQARREVPVKVMMDIVDYLRQNPTGISRALETNQLRSFRVMRAHALTELPNVKVDVACEDRQGRLVSMTGLDRFPRKELRNRKLSLIYAMYYVNLTDLYDWHIKLHGNVVSSRIIDVSVDGVPESRSSGLSIDVLCIRFADCRNVYAVAILQPWKKRMSGKDAAILAPFLGDLPASGLKVRRIIADAPKRAPMQGLKSHAAKSGCPYCKAHKINGQYPSSTMDHPLRTDADLRQEGAHVAAGGSSHDGVKGIGLAACIPGLDLIRDIPAECMHCIHLGVCRKMIKLMYKQKAAPGGQKLYPVRFTAADDAPLNAILRQQKGLSHFSRRPRDLDCAVYKAEEYRNLNIAYWPAVMQTAPADTVKVWLLTVYVVRALSLPNEQYRKVEADMEDMLRQWYVAYERCFTAANCTHYTHVFHHLQLVRDVGPLEETSAKAFEDFYAVMKQNYRAGTTATGSQALTNTMLAKKSKHSCKPPRFLSMQCTERVDDRYVYLKTGVIMQLTHLSTNAVRGVRVPHQRAVGLLRGVDFSDVLVYRVDLRNVSNVHSDIDPSDVLGLCVLCQGYCTVVTWPMLSM